MKVRPKPVVLEAFQWNRQSVDEWPEWMKEPSRVRVVGTALYIDTPDEGPIRCNPEEWVLQDPAIADFRVFSDDWIKAHYDTVQE